MALAVLAIAMSASIYAATQSILSAQILRDRTLASWVALNIINQRLLNPAPWPEQGEEHGTTESAQRTWYWQLRFSSTDDPDLQRLDIIVRGDSQQILSNLSAFRARAPTFNMEPLEQQVPAPK